MGVNVSRGDACGGRKKLQNNKNIIASTEVIVSSHTNMNPNELKRRNKEIEAEILRDQKANARVIKLLLLGTAECGKSTILKQMRILHSAGFSDSEVRLQKCSIFENILNSIVTLIEAVQNEKLLFSSEDLQIEAQMMCKLKQSNTDRNCLLSPQTLLTIKRLWIEDSIQKIFADSSDYHLPDSTKYFLDDIDRIGSPSYVPTEQDILRLRIATTGINEVEFTMKNTKYRVFDVGGQRSERRKWIHCFDNVNAVIYVAALSDYNLTLAEDNHTNRLQESVKLFETICNSKWFLSTPMLLFLNKRDLFVDKIKTHPLTMAFPEYTGPQTYEDGVSYVHKKFTGVNRQPNREIYVHKTCATDTKDMEFVFDACFDIISQLSMQRSGLI